MERQDPQSGISFKKVLVTGGTGYIGSRVARELLRSGYSLRILAKDMGKAERLFGTSAEIMAGDIVDWRMLNRALNGVDAVFHFAAALADRWYPFDHLRQVNVVGTRFLAEQSADQGVQRFFHISTAWVYGLRGEGRKDEHSPLEASGLPYCDTKMEAEAVVRGLVATKGLPAVILQPTQVYGPGNYAWTAKPIELIKSGRMIYPNKGKGLLQPIYIDDLVRAIMLSVQRGRAGEAYLLGGQELVTVKEFFDWYRRMLGKGWIPSMPAAVVLTFAKFMETGASMLGMQTPFSVEAVRAVSSSVTYCCEKSERELGFLPETLLEQGMKHVGEWLREEGTKLSHQQ